MVFGLDAAFTKRKRESVRSEKDPEVTRDTAVIRYLRRAFKISSFIDCSGFCSHYMMI